jgi:hypothetical protein
MDLAHFGRLAAKRGLQQRLRRQDRAVAAARAATTGVARLALLEEPTSRGLALLLQGICSHSRLLAPDESRRTTRLEARYSDWTL